MSLASVIQVYPTADYQVYIYFADGSVRKYDAAPLIEQGVFAVLKNPEVFRKTCTVLNGTLAWDLSGHRDPYDCLDLDAENLFNTCPKVKDPLEPAA
ncbi:MAG: DUF2442 domain-containing protein [Turneriella sp.]